MEYVNDLQRAGAAVMSALVKGKADRNSKVERVNLIEDRLSREVPVQLGRGLRYSRRDRWDALEMTLRDWLDSGALPYE
jgi:hypothetical protein